jgi:hypothetical protein
LWIVDVKENKLITDEGKEDSMTWLNQWMKHGHHQPLGRLAKIDSLKKQIKSRAKNLFWP